MRCRKTKSTRSKRVYPKPRSNEGQKRQHGSFVNLYSFAYACRVVVNEATKVAPGVIKASVNDINKIAEQKINQIISQGGKEAERILAKILRGAIEDVRPFRLLSNFGKQQLNKISFSLQIGTHLTNPIN